MSLAERIVADAVPRVAQRPFPNVVPHKADFKGAQGAIKLRNPAAESELADGLNTKHLSAALPPFTSFLVSAVLHLTDMVAAKNGSLLCTLLTLIANLLIPVSIIIFAIGFFPYKPFLPGLAEYESIEYGPPPDAPFDKVIFMVVDALRRSVKHT